MRGPFTTASSLGISAAVALSGRFLPHSHNAQVGPDLTRRPLLTGTSSWAEGSRGAKEFSAISADSRRERRAFQLGEPARRERGLRRTRVEGPWESKGGCLARLSAPPLVPGRWLAGSEMKRKGRWGDGAGSLCWLLWMCRGRWRQVFGFFLCVLCSLTCKCVSSE